MRDDGGYKHQADFKLVAAVNGSLESIMKLSESGFAAWCGEVGLSDAARAEVAGIRGSPPSRLVSGRAGNVHGRYPSRKMGHSVQFESHTVELPFIMLSEFDDDILEIWDQPPQIPLDYQAKAGRRWRGMHTPDFFVLAARGAWWVECKQEEKLQELSVEQPNRYQRVGDTDWICPPGQAYAAQFGLEYRVFSSKAINWKFQENISFLAEYLQCESPVEVRAELRQALIDIVCSQPGVRTHDIIDAESLQRFPNVADSLYLLIARGEVCVDLHSEQLARRPGMRIYADAESAQSWALAEQAKTEAVSRIARIRALTPGATVTWRGGRFSWIGGDADNVRLVGPSGDVLAVSHRDFDDLVGRGEIANLPELPAHTGSMTPAGRERMLHASRQDHAEATRRHPFVQLLLRGEHLPAKAPPLRTCQQWCKDYRDAEVCYGNGHVGLLPKPRSGNSSQRLDVRLYAIMRDVIRDKHLGQNALGLKRGRAWSSYVEVCRLAQEKGLPPPSHVTFYRAVNNTSLYEQKVRREGRRAAYGIKEDVPLEIEGPERHGVRAWEMAHLDHTQLDVQLMDMYSNRVLGRPWLTLMVDAFSRRILALYLTFDEPSYRSCMMVIRDCVRRWNRLPSALVVDGGSEFDSVYFESLLTQNGCIKRQRPSAEPRHGAIGERLFGTLNTQLIHNLEGNTTVMRNVRQVTVSVDPARHAIWSLETLYLEICAWAYGTYDTAVHRGVLDSPRNAFEQSVRLSGERDFKRIAYDDDFLRETLPTTRTGVAKLNKKGQVQLHHVIYKVPSPIPGRFNGTRVEVKYDPFDAGYILVRVGRWVKCFSYYHSHLFKGMSERLLRLASAELRAKNRASYRASKTLNVGDLAAYLHSVDVTQAVLMQRKRDALHIAVNQRIAGGPVPAGGVAPAQSALVVRPVAPEDVNHEPVLTLLTVRIDDAVLPGNPEDKVQDSALQVSPAPSDRAEGSPTVSQQSPESDRPPLVLLPSSSQQVLRNRSTVPTEHGVRGAYDADDLALDFDAIPTTERLT